MRYPMITGHTGNDGTPANSIESVNKSISLGADAFEIDIRKDENSVLILSHDKKSQSDYNKCVRLSEVFQIASQHPEIRINCDLKDDDLQLDVVILAKRYGICKSQLIFTGTVTQAYLTQHPEIVEMADFYLNVECVMEDLFFQMVSQEIDVDLETFRENPWKQIRKIVPAIDPFIMTLSEICRKYDAKGINMPYGCVTDANIKHFKDLNLPISVWTVSEEVDMARLFSFEVDNLTTRSVETAKFVRMKVLGF